MSGEEWAIHGGNLEDRPITADDLAAIQAQASGVPLRCYACDAEITEPGGMWLVARPNTAYPHCASCVGPRYAA